MTDPARQKPSWFDDIGRLRIAGYLEGTTLVTLLFVAVPLKRLADIPDVVSLVGPIRGATFVLYVVCAMTAVFGGTFEPRGGFRVAVAAFIPFGTFLNDRFLARKHWEPYT